MSGTRKQSAHALEALREIGVHPLSGKLAHGPWFGARFAKTVVVAFARITILLVLGIQASADDDLDRDNASVRDVFALMERMAALMVNGNAEELGKSLSTEFVASDPSNSILDRDDLLAVVASRRLKYESIEHKIDFAKEMGPGLVVVIGTESTTQSAVPAHGELERVALSSTLSRRFTNVYRREQGVWRLLVRQSTIISAEY